MGETTIQVPVFYAYDGMGAGRRKDSKGGEKGSWNRRKDRNKLGGGEKRGKKLKR